MYTIRYIALFILFYTDRMLSRNCIVKIMIQSSKNSVYYSDIVCFDAFSASYNIGRCQVNDRFMFRLLYKTGDPMTISEFYFAL